MGAQIFLDYTSKKPWLAQLIGRVSGSSWPIVRGFEESMFIWDLLFGKPGSRPWWAVPTITPAWTHQSTFKNHTMRGPMCVCEPGQVWLLFWWGNTRGRHTGKNPSWNSGEILPARVDKTRLLVWPRIRHLPVCLCAPPALAGSEFGMLFWRNTP